MKFNKSLFFAFAIFSFTNMQATSSTSHIARINPKDIAEIEHTSVKQFEIYSANLVDGTNIVAENGKRGLVCRWINVYTGDNGTCDAANFNILKDAYVAKLARIAAEEKTKNQK